MLRYKHGSRSGIFGNSKCSGILRGTTRASSRDLKMATLADELQNDFADSGSEDGIDENRHSLSPAYNGQRRPSKSVGEDGEMELDDDNGDIDDDEDLEMRAENGLSDYAEDKEKAKPKIHTSEPKDMRTVASFMKSMEPVLEVGDSPIF